MENSFSRPKTTVSKSDSQNNRLIVKDKEDADENNRRPSSSLSSSSASLKKEKEKKKKTSKKKLRFPWWFKIFAYILSGMIISVSVIFIIFKGIVLGDTTVQKWLTSFIVSAITSVLFTQPLKVFLNSQQLFLKNIPLKKHYI